MPSPKKMAKLKRRMRRRKTKKNRKPKVNQEASNEPRAIRDNTGWLTGIEFPTGWTQEQIKANWDKYLKKFMDEDEDKRRVEEEKMWRDIYNDPGIQIHEKFLAEARAASELDEEEV